MSSRLNTKNSIVELSPRAYCRTATAKDLPSLNLLEANAYGGHAAEPIETYAKRIAEFPEGGWVLEVKEQLIGHCFFERWAVSGPDLVKLQENLVLHQKSPWMAEGGNCLYLASLAVHPQFQGNGWGHWLCLQSLTRIFKSTPSLSLVSLVVAESNEKAMSLYLKLGFHHSFKIRNGYYEEEPRRPVWFMTATRNQLKLS